MSAISEGIFYIKLNFGMRIKEHQFATPKRYWHFGYVLTKGKVNLWGGILNISNIQAQKT